MPGRTLSALLLVAGLLPCLLAGCSPGSPGASAVTEIAHFPIDDLAGVLTSSGVVFDEAISSDGNGALRVEATQPTSLRLYEIDGLDVDNAVLTYRAKLRAERVEGQAYLEMWVRVAGMGEAFSRGLHAPLSGTVDWTSQEIPFFLEAGQRAELVKLNVVIAGTGTVWIDDIHLLQAAR